MYRSILILSILPLLIISSCNLPLADTQTPPEVDLSDLKENTLSAKIASPSPTLSPTPEPTLVTNTPSPTETPTYSTINALISAEPVTITTIEMISREVGWGIGHQGDGDDHIIYTQDGGQTWADRTPPEPAPPPDQKLVAWGHFEDQNTAWVILAPKTAPPPISPKVVWNTHDGGQTWQASQALPLNDMESFFKPEDLTFVDQNHGWLLVHVDAGMSHDYSNLFATVDGGLSWQRIVDPYSVGLQSLHNTGLASADTQLGWVTKDNLGILPGAFLEATTDGGQTWEQVFLPAPPDLNWFKEISQCTTLAPTFTSAQNGIVITNCKTTGIEWTHTYIFTTQDRGASWDYSQLPTPVEELVFLDPQRGWALGQDIYQTSDGGENWELVKSVSWEGQFSFIDLQYGWAVARDNDQEQIALVRTVDGGKTWQIIEPVMR